jgi:hypothetical protein
MAVWISRESGEVRLVGGAVLGGVVFVRESEGSL